MHAWMSRRNTKFSSPLRRTRCTWISLLIRCPLKSPNHRNFTCYGSKRSMISSGTISFDLGSILGKNTLSYTIIAYQTHCTLTHFWKAFIKSFLFFIMRCFKKYTLLSQPSCLGMLLGCSISAEFTNYSWERYSLSIQCINFQK